MVDWKGVLRFFQSIHVKTVLAALVVQSLLAIPINKFEGGTFFETWLCLAPAQDPSQIIG